MRLIEAAEPTFARHETFHPRYGWFYKAYAFAALDPHAFIRDDAPVVIGVGKNMVRAIRFWGLAAKLIVEDPKSPNKRRPLLVPTRFGHSLFGEFGWDPYMEDPGTLWLLHWSLLAPPSLLPAWWLVFNEFHPMEFTDDDLEIAITGQLEAVSEWASPHPSSVKKDISALIRTYAPAERSRRIGIDDLLDCPLRELRLIQRSPATGHLRFTSGNKPTLPPAIVVYAVLDYVCRIGVSANTIDLNRLTLEAGAPGKAFKLSESELSEALAAGVERVSGLALSTLAGASQLSWSETPGRIAARVLSDYYATEVDGFEAGPAADKPIDDELLDDLGVGREGNDAMRALLSVARTR
jgi:hypothetical protein